MTESWHDTIVLGTAQLGMSYGIANTTGRPSEEQALTLLQSAAAAGLRTFDTAWGYGDSETLLGRLLPRIYRPDTVRLITKFSLQNLDGSPANAADRLRRDLEATLTRLGVPRLEALLLHREGDLPAFSGALAPVFADFLRQGLVGRLGVSVYSPARCLEALASPLVGAIELPANILDRRFEREGVFELARRKGVALYLRSVFLQGLLVMPLAALPSRMAHAAPYLERLRRLCQDLDLAPASAALLFVREAYPGSHILFGAEQADQVSHNMRILAGPSPAPLVALGKKLFHDVPEAVLNPSLWPAATA